MIRRLGTMAILVAAGALTACGGSAAKSPAPREPSYYGRPAPARGTATVEVSARAPMAEPEADVDGDSVQDAQDFAADVVRGSDLAAPSPPPPAAPPPPPPSDAATRTAAEKSKAAEEPAHDTSKIVYTATITMAVYQVEQGVSAVERIARDMGGYLAKKSDRAITIRVPRARFQPALAAVDEIGDVLHRDVSAEDVTDQYVDLEIRIKNARAMQARLKQLLEKANVKEALAIEKELARVTQELELLEGKMKLLRDKIAYSTITVAFQPRGSTLQTKTVRLPFPWLSALGLPQLLNLREGDR